MGDPKDYSTLSIKWEFDKMGIWTPSGGLEVSLIIHGKMGIRYTRAKSGNFENGTLVFHSKMGIYPQNSCSGVAKWDPILSRGYCMIVLRLPNTHGFSGRSPVFQ